MNPARSLERVARHYQRGELSQALAETDRLLSKRPKLADALHLRGLILDRLGRRTEALTALRRAARLQPDHPQILTHLGTTLIEAGQTEEAEEVLQRATRLAPGDPNTWYQLGTASLHRGDKKAAREALERAHRQRPDHTPTLNNLAIALFGEDDQRAEKLLRQAISITPEHPEAWGNLAELLCAAGRFEEIEGLLQNTPIPMDHFRPLLLRQAQTFLDQTYLKEAARILEDLLGETDKTPSHLTLLGKLRYLQGRFIESEALLRESLHLDPTQAETWHLLGAVAHDRDNLEEAERAYRQALALSPHDPNILNNIGLLHHHKGDFHTAREFLQRAVQIDPTHTNARNTLGLVLLALGEYEQGFQYTLDRPSRISEGIPPPPSPFPLTLHDRHLLLIKDQGLGDELFYLRWLPQLHARGADVTYLSTNRLAPLLRRTHPEINIITKDDPRPQIDFCFSVGDLPLALGAEYHPPLPLTPRGDLLTQLARQLEQLGPPPYLGLTWRAGNLRANRRTGTPIKRIPLPALATALADWPGTLLALQRHPEPGELGQLGQLLGHPVFDLTTLNEDLEVMLAVLDLIDEYVAVSNTNVHLRASLGKPSRVLVPLPYEWRWGLTERSPWFPDHPLYRQDEHGGWHTAIENLHHDLEARG